MPEARAETSVTRPSVTRRSVDEVLADPSVSFPLKGVLRAWMERDRIDAAHDARLLCQVLEARADVAFGRPA